MFATSGPSFGNIAGTVGNLVMLPLHRNFDLLEFSVGLVFGRDIVEEIVILRRRHCFPEGGQGVG